MSSLGFAAYSSSFQPQALFTTSPTGSLNFEMISSDASGSTGFPFEIGSNPNLRRSNRLLKGEADSPSVSLNFFSAVTGDSIHFPSVSQGFPLGASQTFAPFSTSPTNSIHLLDNFPVLPALGSVDTFKPTISHLLNKPELPTRKKSLGRSSSSSFSPLENRSSPSFPPVQIPVPEIPKPEPEPEQEPEPDLKDNTPQPKTKRTEKTKDSNREKGQTEKAAALLRTAAERIGLIDFVNEAHTHDQPDVSKWLKIIHEAKDVRDSLQFKAMARSVFEMDPAIKSSYKNNIETFNSKILYSFGRIKKSTGKAPKKAASPTPVTGKEKPHVNMKTTKAGRKKALAEQDVVKLMQILQAKKLIDPDFKQTAWEGYLIEVTKRDGSFTHLARIPSNNQLKTRFAEVIQLAKDVELEKAISYPILETPGEIFKIARDLGLERFL